ncbi:MAG TPA: succinate dehydrogenase assembly factor 2 [Alphaproteobacteria bacterium]|nr:succinate dehydrogenase assembly factor 2 [Alphaproteobacteria bacterium]
MEDIEAFRRKLKFRAWHRGTREMDLLMGQFADAHLGNFNETELNQFSDMLEENDPDLYDWYCGLKQPPANIVTGALEKFLAHKRAATA